MYYKWPDNIFPTVKFVFPHDGHFGLGGGGGGGALGFNYSKDAMASPPFGPAEAGRSRGAGDTYTRGGRGRHNICGTAGFPLWPFVYIVICHGSLKPPRPHPPSGIIRTPGGGGGGGQREGREGGEGGRQKRGPLGPERAMRRRHTGGKGRTFGGGSGLLRNRGKGRVQGSRRRGVRGGVGCGRGGRCDAGFGAVSVARRGLCSALPGSILERVRVRRIDGRDRLGRGSICGLLTPEDEDGGGRGGGGGGLEGGRGGVWDPKICVPKMARQEGGGLSPPPRAVYGHSNTSLGGGEGGMGVQNNWGRGG